MRYTLEQASADNWIIVDTRSDEEISGKMPYNEAAVRVNKHNENERERQEATEHWQWDVARLADR